MVLIPRSPPALGAFWGANSKGLARSQRLHAEDMAGHMLATPASMSSSLFIEPTMGLECCMAAGLNAGAVHGMADLNFCKVSLTQKRSSDLLLAEVTGMRLYQALVRDTRGVSSVEYSLILAIIGTLVAIAAVQYGGIVAASVNNSTACVATGGRDCAHNSGGTIFPADPARQ